MSLVVFFTATAAWAQAIPPVTNSPLRAMAIPDSLSPAKPSPAPRDTSGSDLDAPINYDAQMIDNFVDVRRTVLLGDAVVKYKNMTLEAGKITVDWDRHLLSAETLPDSLVRRDSTAAKKAAAPTLGEGTDGREPEGLPVFSDGRDRMTGERMEFNFKTEKGRVTRGRTEFEDGKYYGQHIKRLSGDTLNVSHGIYTTCDLPDDPHFHFASRRMKIIVNDKVVARPIVMYLGKIPILALPFGVFPTRPGRHSGLIMPRFGQSVREGRYLRGLGYYWAASDYWDARFSVDYYDRSGWLARSYLNYAWRYHFNGSLSGSLTRRSFAGEGEQRRWDLAFTHSQNIGTTARLSASGIFMSDNSFYRDFSFNQAQRLTRRLQSSATFSKNWPEAKNNLSLSVSELRDLEDGSIQRSLPQLSFYYGQRQIFGGSQPAKPGSTPRPAAEPRWYENFYFGFSSTASNSYTKQVRNIRADSSVVSEDRRRSASHRFDLSLNSPKRYFGWLHLSQGLNFNEDWFDRTSAYTQDDSTRLITSSVDRGFAARHTFSYSARANTKIYGTFQPHLGPIKALRHVMTPSVSFSYRPDFSNPSWGYYEEFVTQSGSIDRRDRFGGTPRGKLASISVQLANLFQMKTGPDDKEKKFDLFNLDFSTGYNFAATQFKLSDLTTQFRANPTQQINIGMSARHSFYVYDWDQRTVVNRLLYEENSFFASAPLRLLDFRVDAGLRLQGKSSGKMPAAASAESENEDEAEHALQEAPDRFDSADETGDTGIPWRANFSFSYSLNRTSPANPTKTIYLTLSNAEVQLTQNWRVGMSAHMDLRRRQIISQSYSFYRNLHCWEAELRWTPSGPYEGFYFRINIKSPTLHDLKYEHRGGRASVFGGIY